MRWGSIPSSPTTTPPSTARRSSATDLDAAFVLDGLLYNESDLELEEHYTDSHGYTEINFAAFAMLGRRASVLASVASSTSSSTGLTETATMAS